MEEAGAAAAKRIKRSPSPPAARTGHDGADLCPVCMNCLSEPVRTECGHIFDAFCLDEWLERARGRRPGPSCPACRTPIAGPAPPVDEALRVLIEEKHSDEYRSAREDMEQRRRSAQERALAFIAAGCERHAAMVRVLTNEGLLWTPAVEAALLAFPRRSWLPPADAQAIEEGEVYDGTPTPLASLRIPGEAHRDPTLTSSAIHAILLEAARVQPANRVLEIGCGVGLLAALAAALAGPEGRAEGVDGDERTVEAAREAAGRHAATFARLGVPPPSFSVARYSELPAASYDRVLCDEPPPAGLEWELCRLLRPGGALVCPLRGALVRIEKPAGGGPCAPRPVLPAVEVVGSGSQRPQLPEPAVEAWLACAGCGERVCRPSDLRPPPPGRPRPWLPDGEAVCLGPVEAPEDDPTAPAWSGARPLARGPLALNPPSRVLSCAACGLLLGRELLPAPEALRFLCLPYLRLVGPAGPPLRPASVAECAACGAAVADGDGLLSHEHCWSLAADGGPEQAGYYCGVRPGAVVESNERDERLAQGAMRVSDVACASCGAALGWRFVKSLRAGPALGLAAMVRLAQEGRYGLVFSRLRYRDACRCGHAPAAEGEGAAAAAAAGSAEA